MSKFIDISPSGASIDIVLFLPANIVAGNAWTSGLSSFEKGFANLDDILLAIAVILKTLS
jgi:hypothetical protein